MDPPASGRNRGLIEAWRARKRAGRVADLLGPEEMAEAPPQLAPSKLDTFIGSLLIALVVGGVVAGAYIYWPRHLERDCPNAGIRLNAVEYEVQRRTCEAYRSTHGN